MYFCGTTFYKDNKSTRSTIVDIRNINSITLNNGLYDDLFVSKDINATEKKWTFETIMYAMFNNDLLAGNINFALETITSIRIKKREKGTFEWITICEIPINTIEDLRFVRTYKYCKGNTDYEFAMIPVLNSNIEGDLSVVECKSEFNGVYIMEQDAAIQMILNFESSQQRNHNATTIQTLGRKKPFYITNGMANYESGSINVTLIRMNSDCSFDIDNDIKYRKAVNDILSNKKPKILKFSDGRIYMIGIVDTISESNDPLLPSTMINWTEIGEADNEQDLYDNGFFDYGDLL